MEENSVTEVEKLFAIYRNNYRVMKTKYLEAGIPLDGYHESPKIDGQSYTSLALRAPRVDNCLHTCGMKAFPEYLEGGQGLDFWTIDTVLTSKQAEMLNDAYERITFNMEVFDEAVKQSRGMWQEYLFERNRGIPFEHCGGFFGFTIQIISQNGLQIAQEILNNRIFRRIEVVKRSHDAEIVVGLTMDETGRVRRLDPSEMEASYPVETERLDPQDRLSVIVDKLMKKFIEVHYICTHFDETECAICKEKFLPQTCYEWPGLVPPIYCPICCEMAFSASTEFFYLLNIDNEQRRKNYLAGVRLYSEYFGFIPASNIRKRGILKQLHLSGVSEDALNMAMKVSSLLPWRDSIKKEYETWAHFLDAADLLVEISRGYGGYRSIATDGHLCLSLGERSICESLTRAGLVHEKEPIYPIHEKFNPNGLLRGDFLVGNVFLEFAGMMDNAGYASRMKNKEKLAKAMGITWIKILPKDLEDMSAIVGKVILGT